MLETLYKEQLMDHYRHPRNKGTLEYPSFATLEHNPSCADSIAMQGIIDDNFLKQLVFEGTGCVISQATASLLTDYAKGKKLEELLAINSEALQKLIGMPLGPLRIKCALLPLFALQQGIRGYLAQHGSYVE